MRSFRRRLQRALLAVPLATAACSSGPPADSCSGAACPGYGEATSTATTTATASTGTTGKASSSRAFSTASFAAATVGGASGTGSTGGTGTTGGGGTTGFIGPHTCSITDAGQVCPQCMCVDLYSEVSGKDAGPVEYCGCNELCINPGTIGTEVLYGCTSTQLDGGGTYGIDCYWGLDCGSGRRPAGLARPVPRDRRDLGGYLARAAHLEAASVVAFRRLAVELAGFGAAASFARRAQRAAGDEVAHARLQARQARRFGARVIPVQVAAASPRSLEAWALENATEGCVGETWGAALARYQALHATDDVLRSDARRIARDETRHAELAWDLARWSNERLDRGARRRVREGRDQAIEGLAGLPDESRAVAEALGLPRGDRRRQLIAALQAEVWS